jgi:SPP1 family predicted phage head-tail adaptor
MKTIGAGERRHRVTILKRSTITVNLESQPVYTATASRWAKIDPLSARELLVAAQSQVFAETTHKITMLYVPTDALNAHDQLQFGTRKFEVVGNPINREELNREIICMCIERT